MFNEGKSDCCGANIAIFPYVGGSNVGQLSNRIAVELEKRVRKPDVHFRDWRRVSGIMKSAEASDKIIVIDGCPLNCSRNTLELAGFNLYNPSLYQSSGLKKQRQRS